MWRLKPSSNSRDQGPLEGRTVEVGKLRLHVKCTIAQGGFSYVYQAKCAHSHRMYALKHIHANDKEGCELVEREINVMLSLRGHPHIVTLHSHAKLSEGRRFEYFLAMDFCDKMLVNVMESREKLLYEEKQLLLIYRDVCNAVYAMHSRSPAIAHRDLKAENVLLGSDGLWKLCDFGSTSTNHKRFESAEEMGREEDIIRKHTTPAYRAPEMWDLFARERISEKVDIWALGCLLYRIAYFKSCFDGESKLQILNGNYRIPESPKYSAGLLDLMRRMLHSSPDKRPDILEVWRDVNALLPFNLRKAMPVGVPGDSDPHILTSTSHQTKAPAVHHQSPKVATSPSRTPTRSPSPGPRPPSRRPPSPPVDPTFGATSAATRGGGAGSFWASQFAPPGQQDDSPSPALSPPTNRSSTFLPGSPPEPTLERQLSGSMQASWAAASPDHMEQNSAPWDRGGTNGGTPGGDTTASSPTQSPSPVNYSPTPLSPKGGVRGDPLIEDFFGSEYKEQQRNLPQLRASEVVSALASDLSLDATLGSPRVASDGPVVENLREQVRRLVIEKAELEAKCGRLANMVRSQRAEIQELRGGSAGTVPDMGAPAGSQNLARSPAKGSTPSSGRGSDYQAQEGAGNGVEPFRSQATPSASAGSEEGKPSLWLNPDDIGEPIALSDLQAFGGREMSKYSAAKPQTNRAAPSGSWAAFDGDSVGSEGTGFGSYSNQQNSSWAAFDKPGVSSSFSGKGTQNQQKPNSGLPPIQWETVTVANGKAASSKRSTQPAGWAGF